MIDLSDVTLLTIDGIGLDIDAIKALKYSSKDIKFGAIKYITAGDYRPNFCKTYKIQKLSYEEYNEFCLLNLENYIDTNHVLLIQSDGFVINPTVWTDKFLNYDYIGAPWDNDGIYENVKDKKPLLYDAWIESNKKYYIGNGGFSLRSKKLLKEVKNLYSEKYKNYPEDAIIGIAMRKELENKGIKFPKNYKIAGMFSCEKQIINNKILSSDNSFGFHCRHSHPDKIKYLKNIIL